ncbi:MAG: hypothetical protein ABIS07_08790 [Dokdonella sp.]
MNLKIGLLALTLLPLAAPALADNHVVLVGTSDGTNTALAYFPPTTNVLVGDTVTFTQVHGFHNAASDPGAPFAFRCPNGTCGADGGGAGGTWTFDVVIPPAAAHQTINFHCDVHGAGVMSGSLAVTNPVDLQSFSID